MDVEDFRRFLGDSLSFLQSKIFPISLQPSLVWTLIDVFSGNLLLLFSSNDNRTALNFFDFIFLTLTPTLSGQDISYAGGWSLWRPVTFNLRYKDLFWIFVLKQAWLDFSFKEKSFNEKKNIFLFLLISKYYFFLVFSNIWKRIKIFIAFLIV